MPKAGPEGPPLHEPLGTPKSEFVAMLENRWSQGNFVCVGLDSNLDLLPAHLKYGSPLSSIIEFNEKIIEATADLALAYKPNSALYEVLGKDDYEVLHATISYVKRKFPRIPVILDAKRGDIGTTNEGYVRWAFDLLGADAITVHPYLGEEAMKPFLDRTNKGVLVLARTSNLGAGEFQDLRVGETGEPLYLAVARSVADKWNKNGNCGLVVGATYPHELAEIRAAVGDIPILIPGIGAQGGVVESTVKAGKDSRNQGMIINAARSIIFASSGRDFAEAARAETQRLTAEINRYRLAA